MLKRCYTCKDPKDPSQFNRNARRKDGLQSNCRDCAKRVSRRHYEANPADYKARAKARKRHMLEQVRAMKTERCEACRKKFHPVCMDFDHRDPQEKKGSVATMIRQGLAFSTILAEIAKCRLICANCHRVRTMKQLLGASSNG